MTPEPKKEKKPSSSKKAKKEQRPTRRAAPDYGEFVASTGVPKTPAETGQVSYSGAPASTSKEQPQHGAGSAAPWVAAHRRAFTQIEVFEDLVYGRVSGGALLCDLARPKLNPGSALTPAILGVPGGCWRNGHKRDTSTIVVTQWAQQFGFLAMSIEYRLIGAAAAPACYQDVQCALRYLHANAAEHNIDPEKIFVIGQSAGGHLAALCATLGDSSDEILKTGGWEGASSRVAAAIPVAGPFELEPKDGMRFVQTEQVFPAGVERYDTVYDAYPAPAWRVYWTPRETVELSASGGAHGMTEVGAAGAIAARQLASPINHVAKGKPPLLILSSETDISAPLPNAERMCVEMAKCGQEFEFEDWPEEGHMQITDRVIVRSLRFLQERFGVLDMASKL